MTIRIDPAVPVTGVPFAILVSGLRPSESVTVTALPIGFASGGGAPPVTADASGVALARTIFNIAVVAPGAPSVDMLARVVRADASITEQRFVVSAVAAAGPTPSGAPLQAPSCMPTSGPSGTDFKCLFYGLEPNGTFHECFTMAGSSVAIGGCSDFVVPANGLFILHTDVPLAPGPYLYTVTSGSRSLTAGFTVTR